MIMSYLALELGVFLYPPLDFFHPLRILRDLTFDEVIAVFAVAKAVAASHVVVVFKGTCFFMIDC